MQKQFHDALVEGHVLFGQPGKGVRGDVDLNGMKILMQFVHGKTPFAADNIYNGKAVMLSGGKTGVVPVLALQMEGKTAGHRKIQHEIPSFSRMGCNVQRNRSEAGMMLCSTARASASDNRQAWSGSVVRYQSLSR